MGKHRKVRGSEPPKHALPKEHKVAKKAAAAGAGAFAVPVAAMAFSSPASAATMSQWDRVAQFESGGDWSINHSSDGCSTGGLQFQSSGDGCSPSWEGALAYLNSHGYDTSFWTQHMHQGMSRSAIPTKDQQILAGEAWLQVSGPGAWANGNAAGLVSMFRGGPNPWGLSGTNVPPGLAGGPLTPPPVPVPVPPPVPTPTPPPPVPDPVHHWRHHHHHHWKHGHWHKPVTPPPVPAPVPAPDPACTDHIVVPGDTVSEVAAANGASLAAVEALNPAIKAHAADYSLIFSGGRIHLPCDATGK